MASISTTGPSGDGSLAGLPSSAAPSSNAYSNVEADLWTTYTKYRPAYPHSLFQQIYTYHSANGGSFDGIAHDAGCGPGITAQVLGLKFKQVICSDFSESAMEAARYNLTQSRPLGDGANRPSFSFKVSAAEDMSWIPEASLEMVTISEALHWTDTSKTLEAAYRVLKTGGTFSAFYYTQPRFPDNKALNAVFRETQAHWCKLRRDFSPESERTLWVEQTGYDCVAFPVDQWTGVQRIKINTGGNDDVWIRDDDLSHMRHPSRVTETVEYVEDVQDWQQIVDLDWIRGWFQSMSPRVDQTYLDAMLARISDALQPTQRTRAVWPVVILLASKKATRQ